MQGQRDRRDKAGKRFPADRARAAGERGEAEQMSMFLSLGLRHRPQEAGITLDEHGWADVEELIKGVCATGRHLDRALLEKIVVQDQKQRYSFSPDGKLIRANQGHSVPVDVELQVKEPPEYLFHGTAVRFLEQIRKEGLLPMSRLYVHLSQDKDTALKVGKRHGSPVVLKVSSGQMHRAGHRFFLSENGVWLIKAVGPEYFEVLREDTVNPPWDSSRL